MVENLSVARGTVGDCSILAHKDEGGEGGGRGVILYLRWVNQL